MRKRKATTTKFATKKDTKTIRERVKKAKATKNKNRQTRR